MENRKYCLFIKDLEIWKGDTVLSVIQISKKMEIMRYFIILAGNNVNQHNIEPEGEEHRSECKKTVESSLKEITELVLNTLLKLKEQE